jgi:hypothetical protein
MKHNKNNGVREMCGVGGPAFITILLFALLLAPMAARAQTQTYAENFDELQSEITGYGVRTTSDTIINVTTDFSITAGLTIPANAGGKTLTIRSANPQIPVTLTRGNYYELFIAGSGAKLILENIIIDGKRDAYPDNTLYYSLVSVSGGEFTMEEGAVLTNNGGIYASCGGVYMDSGTFTMSGGEISGNIGGGVALSYGGKFIMAGGKISANTAWIGGGVLIDAAYTSGSGEYIGGGTFVMTGGEISGNTAEWELGGGVYVNGSEITMTGGSIGGNIGGGVFVDFGYYTAFTLGGRAVISGNTSYNVYLAEYDYIRNYITLSTSAPPVPGMNIGIQTETPSGVIVDHGAKPGEEAYFHADEPGKTVIFRNNQLVIADKPVPQTGDINGDGNINLVDLATLARWLAAWDNIVIHEECADVDLDGNVTPNDLTVMRRYFAGWTGYETLPYLPWAAQ